MQAPPAGGQLQWLSEKWRAERQAAVLPRFQAQTALLPNR
tara:strand:- start:925 stop:1044 length:120 start_codon:yes stop_codon:yes gene_type:complete